MDDCGALIERYKTKLEELQKPLRNLLNTSEFIKYTNERIIKTQIPAMVIDIYVSHEIMRVENSEDVNSLKYIITQLHNNCKEARVWGYHALQIMQDNLLIKELHNARSSVKCNPKTLEIICAEGDMKLMKEAILRIKRSKLLDTTIQDISKAIEILETDGETTVDDPTFGSPEIKTLMHFLKARERGSGPREGGGAAAPVLSKTQMAKQRVAAERAALNADPVRKEYLTGLVQSSRNGRYYEQLHGVGLVRKNLPDIPDEKKPNDGEIQYMKSLPRFSEQQTQRFTAERAALNANPARKQYLKDLMQGRDSRYFDQLRGLVINNLPDIPEDEQPNDGEIQYMKSLSRYTQNVPELGGGRRTRRRRNRKSKSRSRSKKL